MKSKRLTMIIASVFTLAAYGTGLASSVVLKWDSNIEPDLAGYKVYYAPEPSPLDGDPPRVVQGGTTTTIDELNPAKSYRFAVTAYNRSGAESGFSNIVTVAELSPPTVEITSPTGAGTVSGIVSVNVSAADNVGVARVEFSVNGVLTGSDTSPPYLYSWDTSSLPPGEYTLTAKAYDAAGNVSESSRTVTVVHDTVPPTVVLTAPGDNAVVSGSVTINAGARDNVGVSMVEISANGTLLNASNAAPYSYVWDTRTVANGSYTLTARASDNSGNVSNSSTVTVTVNNTASDVTAPAVSIQSPISGALVKGTVTVTAGATDTAGVTRVEFFVNGNLQASSSSAPYSFNWNTAKGANGTCTLTAKAYDAAGNIGQSTSINVMVNNPAADVTPPTVTFSSPTSQFVSGSSIRIGASAKDGTAVARMELYIDGTLKLRTNTGSIDTSVSIAKGVHEIKVKAYDVANNSASVARTVRRLF